MPKPITIVGAGQMGSMLAYRLLNRGKKVRIFDSRKKYEKKNNQIPWGWLRKFSLQSKIKKNLVTSEFPIKNIEKKINLTYGPMLLSSTHNKSVDLWNKWIRDNPDTDAKVFTPKEASNLFKINEDYFKENGGVFMCDTRDCLMDFKMLNDYLWDKLESDPNCELIQDCKIDKIITDKNNIATDIVSNGDNISIDKTVFTIGNQTSEILDKSIPIIKIELPFSFVKHNSDQNFIALWNKYSSINYFSGGSIKIACGTQSVVNYDSIKFNTAMNFISMGLGGMSNLHFNKSNESLINLAIEELKYLNIIDNPEIELIDSCTVDMTPNLCPYIYYLPKASNILTISGFSGSGSIIIDKNFTDLILDSVILGKLDNKLSGFKPKNNFIYNLTIPDEKKTPLSSIISRISIMI